MRVGLVGFNTYLLVLALLAGAGCASNKTAKPPKRKAIATLRLHLTAPPNVGIQTETVSILGLPVVIRREEFLNEASVEEAKAVQIPGRGYQLEIQFDSHGTLMLDSATTENRGRHIAIFSQFGRSSKDSKNQAIWLACPQIRQRITDGVLVFTPDCSWEDALLIADGLNSVAEKNR